MRKLLLSLVLAILFGGATVAQAAPAAKQTSLTEVKGLTAEQRQQNLESFDLAWQTVRDAHYDPKLGGVNWENVRQELRPRIEQANSMTEARAIMHAMLDRLGHSHLNIIPAARYDDSKSDDSKSKTAQASVRAVPGFDLRMLDGEAVVVSVSAGLPAARAGVRPGWVVRKLNGKDLAPLFARIRAEVKKADRVPLEQVQALREVLGGAEGKEVVVTFLDGAGKEVTLPISRAQPRGHRVQFGQMPPVHVHCEARKLEREVAYFALSSFFDPARVMKAFGDTVQENLDATGFILDLRGNTGGLIVMAQGLGGWFVEQPNQKLGTLLERHGPQALTLNPRQATYKGPLAILVDELSLSSSEFLAGGLQDLHRARVFGRPTGGAALASRVVRLPNGDRLQYVTADYVSANGKRLEGKGVQPDEVVPLSRQALLAGRDPILEAALRWIDAQRDGVGSNQKQ